MATKLMDTALITPETVVYKDKDTRQITTPQASSFNPHRVKIKVFFNYQLNVKLREDKIGKDYNGFWDF